MNWSNSDKFVSIISVNDYVLPCLYGDTLQAVEYHRSVNTSMHCMVTKLHVSGIPQRGTIHWGIISLE